MTTASRPSSPMRSRAGGAAPFGTDILEDDFDELHDFHGDKHAASEMRTPIRLDSMRGFLNALALIALALALLGIFLVWPVTSAVKSTSVGAEDRGRGSLQACRQAGRWSSQYQGGCYTTGNGLYIAQAVADGVGTDL